MTDILFPPFLREIYRAAIYSVSGKILIHSLVSKGHAPSFVSPPFISLEEDTSPDDLGSGVFKALDESKASREQPTRWGTFLVRAEKTQEIEWWNRLIQRAHHCLVERSAIAISIIPLKKWPSQGKVRGYARVENQAIHIPLDASAKQLGKALFDAFERCE